MPFASSTTPSSSVPPDPVEQLFEVTLATGGLLFAGAVLGGFVQGTLGFGGGYVAVPLLAVLLPESLPGGMLLGFLPLMVLLAWRERRGVDPAAFRTISIARVPGILAGTVVVAAVSTDVLTLVIAVALLLAVVATVAGWELEATPMTQRVIGALSGFTATTVALGGPPMALLYHRAGADDRRGTLSAIFLLGLVLTLGSLAVAGELGTRHVPLAVLLAAGLVLGSVVAPAVNRRVADATLRRAVLTWAAVGALVAAGRVVLVA